MSLLHLLSVGQCFTKGRSTPSPYRVIPDGRVPDFSRGHKPIFSTSTRMTPSVQSELFSSPGSRISAETEAGLNPTPSPAAAGRQIEFQAPVVRPLVIGGSFGNAGPVENPQSPKPVVSGERDGTSFVRRLFVRGNTRLERRPAGQSQLLLEGVKVVRNDLSETDLEFVAPSPVSTRPPVSGVLEQAEFLGSNGGSAPQAVAGVSTAVKPSGKVDSGRTGWGRYVGRLFLSGRSGFFSK